LSQAVESKPGVQTSSTSSSTAVEVTEGEGLLGRFLGGVKSFFRGPGGKTIKLAGDALLVASASNEGEALGAVTLIIVCASNPAIGAGCAVVGLGVAAAAIGHAIYRWWKGPTQVPVPPIDLPLHEETTGSWPDAHVEHESIPQPAGASTATVPVSDTPAPTTLRMRDDPKRSHPEKPSLSIRRNY
jgi:hypothetical protein